LSSAASAAAVLIPLDDVTLSDTALNETVVAGEAAMLLLEMRRVHSCNEHAAIRGTHQPAHGASSATVAITIAQLLANSSYYQTVLQRPLYWTTAHIAVQYNSSLKELQHSQHAGTTWLACKRLGQVALTHT
jgi:uncharacterized membrane protein YeiB